MKTNKSFTKRLRVTRTGKLIARKPGQDHFNAKKSRANQLAHRRSQRIKLTNKARRRFLPNN